MRLSDQIITSTEIEEIIDLRTYNYDKGTTDLVTFWNAASVVRMT